MGRDGMSTRPPDKLCSTGRRSGLALLALSLVLLYFRINAESGPSHANRHQQNPTLLNTFTPTTSTTAALIARPNYLLSQPLLQLLCTTYKVPDGEVLYSIVGHTPFPIVLNSCPAFVGGVRACVRFVLLATAEQKKKQQQQQQHSN